MSPKRRGSAVRAVVAASLRSAARSSESHDPPAAVMWADPERAWEHAIHSIQEAVTVLTLGDWSSDNDSAQGPAIWIRAVLAAPGDVPLPGHLAVRDPQRPEQTPWVIYLPGVHRYELTDLSQISTHLAPLADIALRSVWWAPPSGHNPWTPHSFLDSKYGGNLDLARDAVTRTALTEVLPQLLDEDIEALRRLGRLDADRLHARVMPDAVRTLLEWIDDPAATRERLSDTEWRAFTHASRSTYSVDPDKSTNLTAAALLAARAGEWAPVWQRFTEAPARYPGIPTALDRARPQSTLLDDDPHVDSWPSWNREEEELLRTDLGALADAPSTGHARDRLLGLAAHHSPRRDSVWAILGQAPLAHAVAILGDLAHAAADDVAATDVAAAAAWYAEGGHVVDRLALDARAAVVAGPDREAVLSALHAVYDPWVDGSARAFQQLVQAHGYAGMTGLDVTSGTCVVYVDALRMDLARRLVEKLAPRTVGLDHRLAAFPTLTPTGQPAVVPLDHDTRAGWGPGPDFDAGDPQGRSLKGARLRKVLTDAGIQILEWDGDNTTGDSSGIGWTQMNDIDSAGHAGKGARFESVVDGLLDRVASRIDGLLCGGWARVVVVTDHGFLLPARPARKVELALAVTEGGDARKPRVARLRHGASTPSFPAVPWTWNASVTMVSAPGATSFEDGVTYDHGGLSLQECVIPVITVSDDVGSVVEKHLEARIHGIRWTGQRCRVDVVPPDAPVQVAIRISAGDADSTVGGPKPPNDDGEAKILVSEEDAPSGSTAYAVVLDPDGRVVAQEETTVGGDR